MFTGIPADDADVLRLPTVSQARKHKERDWTEKYQDSGMERAMLDRRKIATENDFQLVEMKARGMTNGKMRGLFEHGMLSIYLKCYPKY